MFAGIDEDGSNGLDFAELVNVFEPASLASAHASAAEGAATATEDLDGFVRFTPEQVAAVERLGQFTPRGTYLPRQKDPMVEAIRRAAKVVVSREDVARVVGSLPPEGDADGKPSKQALVAPPLPDGSLPPVEVTAEGRVDLKDEWTDGPVPFDPLLKRAPETRSEQLDLVKRQIAGRLRRRGADFFTAWRRFDEHDRGFLTQQQFVGVCGPKGFDLGLSRRGVRVLLAELSDAGGAVEPLRFDAFLKDAGRDLTTGDAMRKAAMGSLRSLRDKVQGWRDSGAAEALRLDKGGGEGGGGGSGKAEEPEDDGPVGIELNRTALLRSALPSTSAAGGGSLLHPVVAAAVDPGSSVDRLRTTVSFGTPTDPGLLVPGSPRGGGDGSARGFVSPVVSARESARRAGTALPSLSGPPPAARRAPLPRSLGLAMQWSDVAGDGPDAFGASPADRSQRGVAGLRRRMMHSRSAHALAPGGESTGRGRGGGAMASGRSSARSTGGPGGAGAASSARRSARLEAAAGPMTSSRSQASLSDRLAATARSGRATSARVRTTLGRTLPTGGAGAVGWDEGDEARLGRMFAEAEDRVARTWRTTMRPGRAAGSALMPTDPSHSAFQAESGRFVRKSELAPGEWEGACAANADPRAVAAALATHGPGGRGVGATTSSRRVLGPHGKALGATLSSLPPGLVRSGTSTSPPPARLRAEARARRGQALLVGIQRRSDEAAARVALRADARAAAMAEQQLRYARTALGVTDEDLRE